MSQGKGYIKLYRDLQDCWIWEGERFSRGQAWVDLLLMANHKDVKIPFGEKIEIVQRGQFITSIAKLAKKWGWSFNTVKRFLNLLENDNMLTRKSDNSKTLITIVNYRVYQGSEKDADSQVDRPVDRPIDRPTDGLMADLLTPNNNDKNDKNDNKRKDISKDISKRKVFTPPTIDEIWEYCRERKNNVSPEKFFDFYESKGWMVGKNKMKDWKAAVRTWEKHDKNERGNKNGEQHNTTQLTEEELRERGFFDLV
jgi:DNA replication protein DnaD